MIKKKFTILLAATTFALGISFSCPLFLETAHAESLSSIDASESFAPDLTVKIFEKNEQSSPIIEPEFTLTNTGNCDLNLRDVDLKYYYTSDSESQEIFSARYAGTIDGTYVDLTSSINGNIEKLAQKTATADRCLNLTFNDGVLKKGQSMKVYAAINKINWSLYDKTNDFSHNKSENIVISLNGKTLKGNSPAIDTKKEYTAPRVTIGSVDAKGGDIIKIPIKLSNIADKGMSKFNVKLTYNPALLECTGITKSEISNDIPSAAFTGSLLDNTIEIGFDNSKETGIKPIYTDGNYAYINFKVKPTVTNGDTSLTLETAPVITDAQGKEYTSDAVKVENEPIKLSYNEYIEKDSSLSINYQKLDKNDLKDLYIPINLYENFVTTIEDNSNNKVLDNGTDYYMYESILVIKKEYLNTLLNKNTTLTVNFTAGKSQTLTIDGIN